MLSQRGVLGSVPAAGSDKIQRGTTGLSECRFGPKEKQATGYWRKLRNEELHDFSSSPNIIQAIEYRETMLAVLVTRAGGGGPEAGAMCIVLRDFDGES
jgi:hypothetical protein